MKKMNALEEIKWKWNNWILRELVVLWIEWFQHRDKKQSFGEYPKPTARAFITNLPLPSPLVRMWLKNDFHDHSNHQYFPFAAGFHLDSGLKRKWLKLIKKIRYRIWKFVWDGAPDRFFF